MRTPHKDIKTGALSLTTARNHTPTQQDASWRERAGNTHFRNATGSLRTAPFFEHYLNQFHRSKNARTYCYPTYRTPVRTHERALPLRTRAERKPSPLPKFKCSHELTRTSLPPPQRTTLSLYLEAVSEYSVTTDKAIPNHTEIPCHHATTRVARTYSLTPKPNDTHYHTSENGDLC